MFNDFSNLNSELGKAYLTTTLEKLRRLSELPGEILSLARNMPLEYSRQYSQVQWMKYDQNGDPEDVTPKEQDSAARSILNSYSEQAKTLSIKATDNAVASSTAVAAPVIGIRLPLWDPGYYEGIYQDDQGDVYYTSKPNPVTITGQVMLSACRLRYYPLNASTSKVKFWWGSAMTVEVTGLTSCSILFGMLRDRPVLILTLFKSGLGLITCALLDISRSKFYTCSTNPSLRGVTKKMVEYDVNLDYGDYPFSLQEDVLNLFSQCLDIGTTGESGALFSYNVDFTQVASDTTTKTTSSQALGPTVQVPGISIDDLLNNASNLLQQMM